MLGRSIFAAAGLATALAAMGWSAAAAELEVGVTGIRSDRGEIGCALFSSERGFPMETSAARVEWLPARQAGVVCRFGDLPSGTYALAVSHDLNGNRKTDTNFFGIPTEDWGVSNGVRPSMRAPRFSEAAFDVRGEGAVRIVVPLSP